MLYTAANEEYLKINDVVKSPAEEFLNFMNFYKKKNQLEIEKMKSHNKFHNK